MTELDARQHPSQANGNRVRLTDVISLLEISKKDIQNAILTSEKHTSEKIGAVQADVQENRAHITSLQGDVTLLLSEKAISDRRARDLFRIAAVGRSSLLLLVAVAGLALGVFNIIFR